MPGKISHLAVRVDKAHRDAFSDVVKKVAGAGMTIERQLPHIGVIIGFVDEARVDAVRGVEGVTSVAEPRDVNIAAAI